MSLLREKNREKNRRALVQNLYSGLPKRKEEPVSATIEDTLRGVWSHGFTTNSLHPIASNVTSVTRPSAIPTPTAKTENTWAEVDRF